MKLMILAALTFSSLNSFAQQNCLELFSNEAVLAEEVLQRHDLLVVDGAQLNRQGSLYIEKMTLDSEIDELIASTGSDQTQAAQDIRLRKQRFEFSLRIKGDKETALAIYRPLYERYKLAVSELIKYFSVEEGQQRAMIIRQNGRYLVKALTAGNRFADLQPQVDGILAEPVLDVEKVLDIYDHVIARTVNEYKEAEALIREMGNDPKLNERDMAGLIYVIDNLTSDSFAERFPSLQVVTDKQISEFASLVMKARPQILVYWLEMVKQDQLRYKQKIIVSSLVLLKSLKDLVFKVVPPQFRVAISNFLGISYNVYVINVHIEGIKDVVRAPDLESRVKVLMEVGPQRKNLDQFLETFARLSPQMDIWIELKTYIGARKNETTYGVFYEKMLAAEAKIKDLNYISMLTVPSKFDNYAIWVVPAIGAGLTTVAATYPTWWPWITSLFGGLVP